MGYSYGMGHYEVADQAGFGTAFLGIYFLMLFLAFIVWLISYVFQGIGLYHIAKKQGEQYPWLAFVPWGRTYLHGKLAGEIEIGKKTMKNAGIWMVVLPIVSGVSFGILYVVFVFLFIFSAAGMSYSYQPMSGILTMIMLIFILLIGGFAIFYGACKVVLYGLVNYQIFGKYVSKKKAFLHMLLSLSVPMYQAIYLFMLRKHLEDHEKEENL